MAKIWLVASGAEPTRKSSFWRELPAAEIVDGLGLDESCRTEDRPRFGEDQRRIFPSVVVVEIENDEADSTPLKAGFYQSPLNPSEVKLLFPQA